MQSHDKGNLFVLENGMLHGSREFDPDKEKLVGCDECGGTGTKTEERER